MAQPIQTPPPPHTSASRPWQPRHTLAALVYLLYGMFYLFGAQYVTNMQAARRSMANPAPFFMLGGAIALLFPWLIYRCWALPLPYIWQPRAQRHTLRISFTLLLGILVLLRIVALIRGGLFMKTWLHGAALVVTVVNATCLLWAGVSRPAWITRRDETAS